jgi:hypothetical protein
MNRRVGIYLRVSTDGIAAAGTALAVEIINITDNTQTIAAVSRLICRDVKGR